jgi:hypothetical protein
MPAISGSLDAREPEQWLLLKLLDCWQPSMFEVAVCGVHALAFIKCEGEDVCPKMVVLANERRPRVMKSLPLLAAPRQPLLRELSAG